MRRRFAVPVRAVVVAVVVLVVAAGGGYAVASSGSGGTIQACAKKSNGALRMAAKCSKSERRVSWAVQGPAGAPGSPGAAGQNGLDLFARVSDTGVLHQHSPGVTIGPHTTTGLYEVTFPQVVSNCVAVANTGPNANNSFTPNAQYETLIGSDFGFDPHAVYVTVTSYNGSSAPSVDAGFNLIVAC